MFAGVWFIAVGFGTEYIAWRFVMGKKGKCQHRPLHRSDLEDEVRRILDRYAESGGNGTFLYCAPDQSRHPQSDSKVAAAEAVERGGPKVLSNPDYNPPAFLFFFYGAGLGLLLPFLSLLFLYMKIFKTTNKRKYLFTTGIIFGSVNSTALILFIMSTWWRWLCLLLPTAVVDLVLIAVLVMTLDMQRVQKHDVAEVSEKRASDALKFFFFGFALGLLTSLFSGVYIFCFPGIQGKESRETMFKYGCMAGALNNLLFMDFLLAWVSGFLSGYIFLYDVFFILFLFLTDKEIRRKQPSVKRKNTVSQPGNGCTRK